MTFDDALQAQRMTEMARSLRAFAARMEVDGLGRPWGTSDDEDLARRAQALARDLDDREKRLRGPEKTRKKGGRA